MSVERPENEFVEDIAAIDRSGKEKLADIFIWGIRMAGRCTSMCCEG